MTAFAAVLILDQVQLDQKIVIELTGAGQSTHLFQCCRVDLPTFGEDVPVAASSTRVQFTGWPEFIELPSGIGLSFALQRCQPP